MDLSRQSPEIAGYLSPRRAINFDRGGSMVAQRRGTNAWTDLISLPLTRPLVAIVTSTPNAAQIFLV
jgi:hypothetical protein